MSRLAPGRKHDMTMLLERRDAHPVDSPKWVQAQLKIDDLIEEGKCDFICHERGRLVNAARAGDTKEVERISELINEHMQYNHRRRYLRHWVRKVQ